MYPVTLVGRVASVIRQEGIIELGRKIIRRLFPPRLREFRAHKHRFKSLSGLEIGGPSQIFSERGLMPVYKIAKRVDNNNYSISTVWQDSTSIEVEYSSLGRKSGNQYVSEATALTNIASETYDFLLSSHVLEHIANPLKALFEWKRVIRPGGCLLLVVPHKDGTFDHRRPITTIDHLVDDFNRNMGEEDLTHLPEILALHDLSLDPGAGSLDDFKERSRANITNRCLHHHVFDTRLAVGIVNAAGFSIQFVRAVLPMHIILLAEKPKVGAVVDNTKFIKNPSLYTYNSPFQSDRV